MHLNSYRHTARSREWAAQSFVIRSDREPVSRWSLQVMRKRSCYGGNERRGFAVFLAYGSLRAQIGSR